jgi:hypothetical protein
MAFDEVLPACVKIGETLENGILAENLREQFIKLLDHSLGK